MGTSTSPKDLREGDGERRVHVQVSLVDQHGREHAYPPSEYAYNDENEDWILEPGSDTFKG